MSENEGVDKLRENAVYLGRMALELARLAQRSNFQVLVYLFNMAAEEAAGLQASQLPPSKPMGPSGQRTPRPLPNSAG